MHVTSVRSACGAFFAAPAVVLMAMLLTHELGGIPFLAALAVGIAAGCALGVGAASGRSICAAAIT
jgi:hypothetical protein